VASVGKILKRAGFAELYNLIFTHFLSGSVAMERQLFDLEL